MGRMLQPLQVALVVEDDPNVRELAATVLEETDLKVVEATVPRRLCTTCATMPKRLPSCLPMYAFPAS